MRFANTISDDRLVRLSLFAGGTFLLRASYWPHLVSAPLISTPVFGFSLVFFGMCAFVLLALAAWGKVHPSARSLILFAVLCDLGLRFALAVAGAIPPGASTLAPLSHVAIAMLSYSVIVVGLFISAPRAWQPLVLIPLIAADQFLFSALAQAGTLDFLWAALLVSAVLLRYRRKRVSWVLFIVGALAFGLLPNRLWIDGSGFGDYPATFLTGLGAASLRMYGILNAPSWFFTGMSLAVIGVGLFLYARHPRPMRTLFWLCLAFAAWCLPSIQTPVWIFILLPAFASALVLQASPQSAPIRQISIKNSLLSVGGVALILSLIGFIVADDGILAAGVRIVYPMWTDVRGKIARAQVEVMNHTQQVIAPHFSVLQTANSATIPYSWTIADGQPTLEPDETALYTVQAEEETGRFYSFGRLMLTDTISDRIMGVTLGPYEDYGFPDVPFNANFQLWGIGGNAPAGWVLSSQIGSAARAQMEWIDGRDALVLQMSAEASGLNSVSLGTDILFPEAPFSIWLYRDLETNVDAQNVLYGIDIQVDEKRVLLLYGETAQAPTLSPTLYLAQETLPARTWMRATIDLRAIFAEAGWALPEPRRLLYREVEADFNIVSFKLLFGVRGTRGNVRAVFGAIEPSVRYIPPQQLMADIFEDPRGYYERLADLHLSMGNSERALEALERAAGYAPGDVNLRAEADALHAQFDPDVFHP